MKLFNFLRVYKVFFSFYYLLEISESFANTVIESNQCKTVKSTIKPKSVNCYYLRGCNTLYIFFLTSLPYSLNFLLFL